MKLEVFKNDDYKDYVPVYSYNIVFPVYNEEKRLEKGIVNTIRYLSKFDKLNYVINIVDNASNDSTEKIALSLCERFKNVYYTKIKEKGVGIAFKTAVLNNKSDIIGYMDIDLSTKIDHLKDVISIFENRLDVDLVNGSRWNKLSKTSGRKKYRVLTSKGLVFLLKLFLKMKSSDGICGFKFFRSETAKELINISAQENGWFFIIEMLIRAERINKKIIELPVHWEDDNQNSTVKTGSQIRNYLHHIKRLRKQFRKEKQGK